MIPLPPLPQPPNGQPWDANVSSAFNIISSAYRHGARLIAQQDSGDPIRLRTAATNLDAQAPLLNALEQSDVPEDWVHESGLALALLREGLLKLARGAQAGSDATNVQYVQPVNVLRTGGPGRPRKVINLEYLTQAFSDHRRITVTRLAKAIGVHRNTLTAYLKLYGVSTDFSSITDNDLDRLVRDFRQLRPASGIRYVIGFLRQHGVKVQRRRAIKSLKRVDEIGVVLRRQKRIQRNRYTVKRPNALWHCDGHHKLIRWGIVIHGFIDGYSRLITALHASNTNSSSRVFKTFKVGTKRYGVPSRLRGDRGGENVKVSTYMIVHRGLNRASFMWGSSTHNTRIERLWVEVGTQFCRQWRAFFLRLERLHDLNHRQPTHLWLLHFLFLDAINDDAENFRQVWNVHPLSTPGLHNQSPHDLFMLGQTEEGIYTSEMDEFNPAALHQHYGVVGQQRHRRPGQTGAGHPRDEDAEDDETPEDDLDYISDVDESDDDLSPLERLIASDIKKNIRHPAVRVPPHANPFQSEEELHAFAALVGEARDTGIIPPECGVDVDDIWEQVEPIPLGRRKSLQMVLPEDIWRPRALLWVQAVHLLERIFMDVD